MDLVQLSHAGNIHDAKTHLSRLLERVEAGEEIVIGRAGKPVARLVPYRQSEQPRAPGAGRDGFEPPTTSIKRPPTCWRPSGATALRAAAGQSVLLWWLADDPGLTTNARSLIASPASMVFVSAASAWEISINRALGRLQAPNDLEAQLEKHHFSPLAISIGHALAAGALPATTKTCSTAC